MGAVGAVRSRRGEVGDVHARAVLGLILASGP
jgi:hypothetical protein